VTRSVCEKISQNVAKLIFCKKIMQNIYHGNKRPKHTGYFCNFLKLPKVKSHPVSETSPNLVTLTITCSKIKCKTRRPSL
jgi:hypothetical protein